MKFYAMLSWAILGKLTNDFYFLFQRPPSSSLSAYGLGNDEARSPSSGGGTPGLLSHQPGSHISGDNISEAGKTPLETFLKYFNSMRSITQP